MSAERLFGGVYAGRKVMVTGHSGFLGSWAVRWLGVLGAQVAGYSRGQRPGTPHNGGIWAFEGDVADTGRVAAAMAAFQPEIVLHLAAASTVTAGFRSPAATFASNVAGTAAVLDAATRHPCVRCAVVMGTPAPAQLGDDLELGPYPASKLAAEACVAAFAHPRTQKTAGRPVPLRIGLARPGVMIGGDWGEGRLLADTVRSIRQGQPVTLGAPAAVRPWQHVLDGVSGALALAARLWARPAPRRRYDFGSHPHASNWPVHRLVQEFLTAYGLPGWPITTGNAGENDRLELGYGPAHTDLGWSPVWDIPTTLTAAAHWYHAALRGPATLATTMDNTITTYTTTAHDTWARGPDSAEPQEKERESASPHHRTRRVHRHSAGTAAAGSGPRRHGA